MVTAKDLLDAFQAADARKHPNEQAFGIEGAALPNVLIDGTINFDDVAAELNKVLARRVSS